MIDSTIVKDFANQTISVINAVTGLLVALTTAAAYFWGHSHGVKKIIRENVIKNDGTTGAGHKK